MAVHSPRWGKRSIVHKSEGPVCLEVAVGEPQTIAFDEHCLSLNLAELNLLTHSGANRDCIVSTEQKVLEVYL